MIRSFRHKGLAELFNKGSTGKIAPELVARVRRRLNALRDATRLGDLDVPGFDFHSLRGKRAALQPARQRPLVHHV